MTIAGLASLANLLRTANSINNVKNIATSGMRRTSQCVVNHGVLYINYYSI